jgi:hypothetical protein
MKSLICIVSILAVFFQVKIDAKSISENVYHFSGRSFGDRIFIGTRMNRGDYLQSFNGVYQAIMQYDGNFVVYRKGSTNAVWYTGTGDQGFYITFQLDGNLCIYSVADNVKWQSKTALKGYLLVM